MAARRWAILRKPMDTGNNWIKCRQFSIPATLVMNKLFHFKRRNPPVLWRIKGVLLLIIIGCMEILPLPVTDSILIFVWLARPMWFRNLVDKLYGRQHNDDVADNGEPAFFKKYQQQHPKHFKK